jgi:hypothetical protein
MKIHLAAAALAVALAQPAAATTFPGLTTIYVGAGVQDTSGAGTVADTATVFSCANVSGLATTVRILLLDTTGGVVDTLTQALPHGSHLTAATRGVAAITGDVVLDSGAVAGGVVNIEATQSGVFCGAALMDATADVATGVSLHLVRVNPHPGTVE